METSVIEVPPYRLSGTVVGALLNDPAQIQALGDAATQPPYKAPPQAPVLEVKPRNTLVMPRASAAAGGVRVAVPTGHEGLEVAASLGVVIGRTACRIGAAQALEHVAGYLVAGDFSLPIGSHYRPGVRLKARDGFCPLGAVVAAESVGSPDALAIEVRVDGEVLHRASTAGRVRGVAQLVADVSEFMTLQPGDVLLLGRSHALPTVRAGQSVALVIENVGTLRCSVVAEGRSEAAEVRP